jgi:hypothetical protein
MFTLITTLVNGYFNNGVMIRPVLYAFLSSILNNTEKKCYREQIIEIKLVIEL